MAAFVLYLHFNFVFCISMLSVWCCSILTACFSVLVILICSFFNSAFGQFSHSSAFTFTPHRQGGQKRRFVEVPAEWGDYCSFFFLRFVFSIY
jgi:hypothetical protein